MKIGVQLAALLLPLGLIACGPSSEPTVEGRWYSESQVRLGTSVFARECQQCHGEKAAGLYPNWRETLPDGHYPPPPLNGSAHAWHHPLEQLQRSIRDGGIPLGGVMPPFRDRLSDEEVLAVIAYFQSQWADDIYALWQQRSGG